MTLANTNCYNKIGWLTGIPRGVLAAILLFPLSGLMQSCFTGIESTPKITYKDVRKQNAGVSPEQEFAGQFRAVPFSRWSPGRRFLLADSKALVTYSAPAGKVSHAVRGDTLVYQGVREVPAITGGRVAELVFALCRAREDTLLYRPGGDSSSLNGREYLRLPFLVDLELVGDASRILKGKQLVTRTDRWLSTSGDSEVRGRKYLNVTVTDVEAHNEDYPFLVKFISLEDDRQEGALLMSTTVDEGMPALREFDNLFLMSDPREDYPQISDTNWELIRRGKVAVGMTTGEASLALGTPRDIDRRHNQSLMYERWSYPGGVYLIFEDGLLVRFNQ